MSTELDTDRIAAHAARDGRAAAAAFLDTGRRAQANIIAIATNILTGYHVGDPEIMDYCPSPLSGEWAGESMPEVLDIPADSEHINDAADIYEEQYVGAWWSALLAECAGHIFAHLQSDTHLLSRGLCITRAHSGSAVSVFRHTGTDIIGHTEYATN